MKESQFINQNKEKWQEAEELVSKPQKDTDRLSSLFVHLTDDLSYARTFFTHRFINIYLNQTAMKFFSLIYTRKKSKWNTFMDFWKEELPQVVIHCRKELLISLFVFVISVGIGVVSAANDPDFVASILGEDYVAMTKENIESGDPMKVYKAAHPTDMFLSITTNNIRVAFFTYVFGLIAGIGTIGFLIFNGIMLGSFQYFFYEHHLLGESMLAVWLHGTLEISSIIIAGGAGIALARGIILPGTLSRGQAFYISASRSLKLLLGTVPIFMVAGFVESFVTRFTEVPNIIRLLFILASLSFIIGYFIIYPWVKSRKGFNIPIQRVKLNPSRREPLSFSIIKTNADLFKDTAFIYFEKASLLAVVFLIGAALIVSGHFYFDTLNTEEVQAEGLFNYLLHGIVDDAFTLFSYKQTVMLVITSVVTGLIIFIINHLLYRQANKGKPLTARYLLLGIINSQLTSFIINSMAYGFNVGLLIAFSMLLPAILLLNYIALEHQTFLLLAIPAFFKILSNNFRQVVTLFFVMVITTFLFTVIFNSPLVYLYWEQLRMNLPPDLKNIKEILNFVSFTLTGFISLAVIGFNLFGIGLLYYSSHEVVTADDLRQRIRSLKLS
ncbi:MAG: stage II sporulation protein M [Chitinophagales bacterium]